MHNYAQGKPTESQLNSNFGVVYQALDNDIYTYWWHANEMSDANFGVAASLALPVSDSTPPSWQLSPAVSMGVCGTVRRHQEWRNGFFKIRVYYSVDVTGGNILWKCGVGCHKEATAFSISYVEEAVSAPVSTNGVYVQEFNNATLAAASVINPATHLVQVGVGRHGDGGTDTATGTVNIYGVELVYVEQQSRAGGGSR